MTIALSDLLANDAVGVIATDFPAGSILEIYTGAIAAITAAPTGTLIASVVLPASPWAAAATRAQTKQGTWSVAAVGSGTLAPGYFRLRAASGTDPDAADNTHKRIQGLVAGPVAGSGTVTTSGTGATFSTSQAGVLNNGDIVNIAGTNYTVSAFSGTTTCTLSGTAAATALAFTTRLGSADLVLDNGVIAAAQTVTVTSLSISM